MTNILLYHLPQIACQIMFGIWLLNTIKREMVAMRHATCEVMARPALLMPRSVLSIVAKKNRNGETHD